jgi:hypothetical protein
MVIFAAVSSSGKLCWALATLLAGNLVHSADSPYFTMLPNRFALRDGHLRSGVQLMLVSWAWSLGSKKLLRVR